MTFDTLLELGLLVLLAIAASIATSYHLENQRLRKANLQASRNDHRDERGRYTPIGR